MKHFPLSPRRSVCLLLMLCIGGVSLGLAQTTFERTYGDTSYVEGGAVRQTYDGGYVAIGTIRANASAVSSSIYLLKIDASGDTIWTRKYGPPAHDAHMFATASAIQQTSDGGYIISGSTGPTDAPYAWAYLIRTNSSGDTLWTREYGWTYCAASVQETSDSGYVFAGMSQPGQQTGISYLHVVKTNWTGDTLWWRYFSSSPRNETWNGANSVQETSDSGYIVAGWTGLYRTLYLIKTNASGDTKWTKVYGRRGWEVAYSVQQTSDGGYIVAGCTGPSSYDRDVYLLKINDSGDTLWTRSYGGLGDEVGSSVQQTVDGGYIIAGSTSSFGAGSSDIYLINTNSSGDALWTRTFGGTRTDEGRSVQQTSDGGYIIAGSTRSFTADSSSKVYLIKTDANGLVAKPLPPLLVAPRNEAVNQSRMLTLLWNASLRATSYRIQLGTDSTFGRDLFLDGSTLGDTSRQVSGLAADTRYFWRVGAMNSGGTSNYSSVWTFATTLDLPAAVTLVSPENNATVPRDSVRFFWRPAWPGVVRYRWELATDSLFGSPVVDTSLTDTSKVVPVLTGGLTYWWKVAAGNVSGWGPFSLTNRFTTLLTDVSETQDMPREFSLSQNYPNPFNPTTTIQYALPNRSHVTLTVFSTLGQQLAELVNGEIETGYHEVQFRASNLSSGVYFYRLQAGDFVETRKLLLIR